MPGERRCLRCGAALDVGGACRRCLLALGLAPGGASVDSRPDPASPDEASPGTPQRVGSFRVLDVLAVGDAGSVSLAEEEGSGGRRVALRVLDPRSDAQEILARFETEQESLASVDHPGIVPVTHAGVTVEGRAWFAAEWVPGVPLTEYCDRERLTVRRRVELLADVCQAVQHAHVKGALHLNLKPSKVLVEEDEGRARPRIVDFGLARALDRTPTEQALYSARALLGGALEYVSPEQLEPAPPTLDARTDVYALGVLLFELLVGGPPFESRRLRRAGWAEWVRLIQQESPPRPSARVGRLGVAAPSDVAGQRRTELRRLARELRGDLDWITLKALEKDPSRRYPSAHGLESDLRRFLSGGPVAPGPRSLLLRLRRALRV